MERSMMNLWMDPNRLAGDVVEYAVFMSTKADGVSIKA